MSVAKKLAIVSAAFVVVVVGAFLYVTQWLMYQVPAQPASVRVVDGQRSGYLTLATTGAIGFTSHPDWVAYLVREHGRWVHSTVYTLPAHALIHVTVEEYDTQTGLRNPFMAMVRGTVGGVEYVNGRRVRYMNPTAPAHTFSVPSLGINVPLFGITNASYPGDLSNPHNGHVTIQFSFRTGGPGVYHWQCFVPCAAGFLYGQGGPMQTIGYMDGLLIVS